MKLKYRTPQQTADVSASRGSDIPEFVKLTLLTIVSIVCLYVLIGWGVDAAVANISYEREVSLFGGLTLEEESGEPEERLEPAKQLLERLQTNSAVPAINYQLVLLEDEFPNAFAFPGGTIGLTSGLLETLDDDIELAFVLAHELGHFHNRDHLRGLGRAIGINLLVGLIFGSQLEVSSVATVPVLVMSSSYSREQETRADEFALELIHGEFGTTENFDALFRSIEEKSRQPAWTEMFSTHPLPGNRILNLQRYAENLQEP